MARDSMHHGALEVHQPGTVLPVALMLSAGIFVGETKSRLMLAMDMVNSADSDAHLRSGFTIPKENIVWQLRWKVSRSLLRKKRAGKGSAGRRRVEMKGVSK